MQVKTEYDAAIIGGGLAGLAAAVQLAGKGHSVVLFEKESYPFHKVCGEYISLESRPFLESLGLPLGQWNLPLVDTLQLTAPNGESFQTKLPLGGFGISRYKLDEALSRIAVESGVHLMQRTKVDELLFAKNTFTVLASGESFNAKVAGGAFGKRSNLDVKWKRRFLQEHNPRLNNYIGIKYHIKTDWPHHVIGLHNFSNGYCGISKIEDDRYCLCYLTTAQNLKASGGSVERMEKEILSRNPHLERLFLNKETDQIFPVTISQISFSKKPTVEKGVLMLGDAAGMITPLCGNGMSIALHTAKLAATLMHECLSGGISQQEMETMYNRQWNDQFGSRLQTGRLLQRFFGNTTLSNVLVQSMRVAPFLARPLIRLTHGQPF